MTTKRLSKAYTITLDSTLADTPEIDMQGFSRGHVAIPVGSSITALTYYASPTKGGTYLPLYDSAKNAITQTSLTAGRAYEMPVAVASVAFLKIATDADGAVHISLKD